MIAHYPTRLQMMQALVKPGTVGAEIGVYRGDFSRDLLANTQVGKLFLVDCWRQQTGNYELDPKNFENHDVNLAKTQERVHRFGDRAKIVVGMSLEVASRWGHYASDPDRMALDFIYLDADHSYEAVLADLKAWAPLIKPGGFIAGHDYVDSTEAAKRMQFGVIRAVTEFCALHGWELVCLTQESDWPSYALRRSSETLEAWGVK